MAFSIGAATVCSITSAEAPGYTACTVTTGGAMSGYCAIGRLRIAARPASTIKIDSTAAKIGRSMKKRENMGRLFLRLWFLRLGRRLAGRIGIGVGDAHRRARPQAHQSLGDHAIAGLHALVDHPGVTGPVTDLDRARLCRAVFIDDVDELALRALEHRALRNGERIRARRAAQDDAHEFARPQLALGIGQLGTRLASAGGGGDAHVGEVELAGALVHRAVGALERDVELAVLRHRDAPGLHFSRERGLLVVRDAEVDPDRINLDHRGEQRLRTLYQRALRADRAARDAGDRRFDLGVCQVELRLGEPRARRLKIRGADLLARDGVVVLLLAHRLLGVKRRKARGIALRLLVARLGGYTVRLGARRHRFERRRIDRVERLAFLHRRALGEVALEDDAADARAHFHLARAGGLADVLEGEHERARRYRLDADFRRRQAHAGMAALLSRAVRLP